MTATRTRLCRTSLVVLALAALSTAALLVSAGSASAAIPSNYFTVVDTGGANDINASQVDMTQLGRDDADPLEYRLFWSWDATDDWTGNGQTGDACALFDTNGNTNIDFAICVRVENPNADTTKVQPTDPAFVFTCGDAKDDRCTTPSPVALGAGDVTIGALTATPPPLPSPPANLITDTDPFPNLLPDQNHPNDSTVMVVIKKSALPAGAQLVNVCSYPSAGNGGNNNPFDCIVNPGSGFLRIVKDAGSNTTQVFNFSVNPGNIARSVTGSGTAQSVALLVGNTASVSESVPANWTLTGATCTLQGGGATGTKTGSTVNGITIESGKITTCTFVNAPQPPEVTVTKDNDANDDGTFSDTETVPVGATYPYTVTYKATIQNTANVAATITTIDDDLAADPLQTAQAGLTDCSSLIGTSIAANSSLTCYFDDTIANGNSASRTNTLSVTLTNSVGSDSDTDTSTVLMKGRIDLTKTPDAGTVSAGSGIGFTLTASNTGSGPATNVTVTDNLPANAGLSWSIDAAGSDTGCSINTAPNPDVLTCNFGTLNPGQSKVVHITSPTTAASCGTVNNTGNVSAGNTTNSTDSASASITVNCGQISLTKVADDDTVSAGEQIGFEITATNTGAGDLTGVQVTDDLPAGLSWSIDAAGSDTGCSIDTAPSPDVLTCTWGTLTPNQSKKVHIVATTDAADCGTVSNTANATTTNDGSSSANDSITVQCPDIGVVKDADASPVSAGDQIGFTVTVSNGGPGVAKAVTLSDDLPAGLTWSESPDNPDCAIDTAPSPDVLECSFGDLASGASRSVHIVATTDPADCGTVNNTAVVSADNDADESDGASVVVQCPTLDAVKTADNATVSAGDQIGFTVTVSNGGPGVAKAVTLSDDLPAGLTWSESPDNPDCSIDTAASPDVLACSFGDLGSGASRSVHIIATTDAADCGTVNNTAIASASNDADESDGASVTVQCPSIDVVKDADDATVSAGDEIGFTITASNAGPGVAKNVTVDDTLPAGLTWSEDPDSADCSIDAATNVLSCNFGDLASGGSASVHVVATTDPADCGTVNNTATVDADNDDPESDGASVTVECPNIDVVKDADDGTISAGDEIGFTITASNAGPGVAKNVTVSDDLPAGLTWSEDPDNPDCSIDNTTDVLSCSFGDLASGGSRSVHVVATTTQEDCGTITNTATVDADNDDQESDGASVTVNCPDLDVTKTPDNGTISAGEDAVFTIVVKNSGAGEAKNVQVSDVLPNADLSWALDPSVPGCSISEIAGGADDGKSELSCSLGTLASGAEQTIVAKATVPAAECATLDNTATATADNGGSANDSGQIRCFDSKAVVVKSGNEFAYHGDNVTFTFVVTNPGNARLHDIVVDDDRCDSVTLQSKTEGPNDSGAGFLDPGDTWRYTCTMAVPGHSDGEANPFKNVVTVTGKDDRDQTVGSTDDHLTKILHPAIDVDKTGPATATAGQPIDYAIVVTNPGDVAFASDKVGVQDSLCEAPPILITDGKRRGDAPDPSPDSLDPGDMWVYTCRVQTQVGQERVDNVATVNGTDFNGRTVQDSDPHGVTLNQPVQQVAPQRIEPGAARLQGPTSCVVRPFLAIIRGRQIASVTLFVGNRRLRTLSAQQARVRVRRAQAEQVFRFRIDPRDLSRGGVHRVRARVVFTTESQTAARTLRLAFQRCRAARAPRFTG